MKYVTLTAAAIGMTTSLQAATIAWNSIQNPTGNASDVVTTGTFFDSAAAYTSANVDLNGVTFRRNAGGINSDNFVGSSITWTNRGTVSANFSNAPVSWDDNYETLASWGIYSAGTAASGGVTINLSGLVSGQQYLVQMWTPYWNSTNFKTQFIAGDRSVSGNSSGLLDLGNVAASRSSQYVVGTFTADATTQIIHATGDAGAGGHGIPSFMQVRAIPEPSAALLGGLGMLALLRRRR